VLFYFARKAAGASRARHSLRPLISEGELSWQNSGASRRGNAELYLNVIARSTCDEAIQLPSLLKQRKLDCFVASLLAMTWDGAV
jgi:hypothetical protein